MANKIYSPQVKQTALQCYVEGMPLRTISENLCVPYGTVHNWHWTEKWPGIRRQMQAQLRHNWQEISLNEAFARAVQTVMRHLTLCNALLNEIEVSLKTKRTPEDLRKLSVALRREYDVFERIFQTAFAERLKTSG